MRLNELEAMQDKQVHMFVKFTSQGHVEDLLNGNLYMQPLKKFIEQEEREQVRGQGDRHEGAVVGRVENATYTTQKRTDLLQN
jgi:hypothetical protein